MSVSLKQIRYFVAAAETGRISQAAMELNVSQSAVTAAIQQLEATVFARLLERTPNGVTVTIEGSRLLAHGRQILAAVTEALQSTHMSAGPLFGTVRIGVTHTVSGYILPRHQMRFQASFPGIMIELFEAPRDVLECAILDGALDLALILVSDLRDNAVLVRETLLRSPRRLWLSPRHPLIRAERVHLTEIAAYPYVMLTSDEAQETSMRSWSHAALEPKTIFRTSSVEAVRSMVAGGIGIAILADLIYRPWSHEGQRVETRVIDDEVPTMDVGLVWRRDAKMSEATTAFRDFMRFAVTGVGPTRPPVDFDHRYRANENIEI